MRKLIIVFLTAFLALAASCNLELAEAPTVDTPSGTVASGKTVRLLTTLENADIRYTIDGTDPKYKSALYESPIEITKNTTLKAAAFDSKKKVSEVVTVEYKVKATKPTANVSDGTYCVAYGSTDGITLLCDTEGAVIYYTLDGTDPTKSSTRLVYSQAIKLPMMIPAKIELKLSATSKNYDYSDINEISLDVCFKGPAGGFVFYDKGSYSDGWRYLEAAPEDIYVGDTEQFAFGYYRTSVSGTNYYANGTTTYEEGTSSETDGKSTGTAIGTGKANTIKLVAVMGSVTYSECASSNTTENYAAKLCNDYTCGVYSDWFLPSKDELNLLYVNLHAKGIGGFSSNRSYWSSSESYSEESAYSQSFDSGSQHEFFARFNLSKVRAIRAF